ncbi:MAG: aldehyde ferredoxin oxidoreductase C-terminal domain-containing protein [Actinomycetota bacterium]|nr:aldehyde ferredoxin oxidoreductase C-terminal domain-containing protein [Actinomycetota bacterium]
MQEKNPGLKDIGLNPDFGLIELESLAATSYNLLVDDMESTLKLWNMICDYGIDGTSLGNVLGYAVECYENGLIGPDQTMGLPLKWSDPQTMLKADQNDCGKKVCWRYFS